MIAGARIRRHGTMALAAAGSLPNDGEAKDEFLDYH